MKAAVVNSIGEVCLEERIIPQAKKNEALVKVIYGGICGTDVHVMMGKHKTAKYPVVLGHEFIGRLVELNTAEDIDAKPGDLVFVQPFESCGTCEACIEGRENVCSKLAILGVHRDGCFAEYVAVPASKVFKMPDGLDMKLATLVEPLAVAVHDVKQSGLKLGQTALIIGGGPIGLLIAIVARMAGATKIVVSEVNDYRLRFAEKLGFEIIDAKKSDLKSMAKDLTESKGFDVVFEVSGTKIATEQMTECVKTGGRIVIVGVPGDKYAVDTGLMLAKEIEMVGVRIHATKNYVAAIEILKANIINDQLIDFIDSEFSLDKIEEAMKYSIEDQKHFKTLIKIGEI